jgi:hypothetical protein
MAPTSSDWVIYVIVAFIGPLRPDSPDSGGPEFFDHVEEF